MKKILGIVVIGLREITRTKRDKSNGLFEYFLITFDHEKTFRDRGSGFVGNFKYSGSKIKHF